MNVDEEGWQQIVSPWPLQEHALSLNASEAQDTDASDASDGHNATGTGVTDKTRIMSILEQEGKPLSASEIRSRLSGMGRELSSANASAKLSRFNEFVLVDQKNKLWGLATWRGTAKAANKEVRPVPPRPPRPDVPAMPVIPKLQNLQDGANPLAKFHEKKVLQLNEAENQLAALKERVFVLRGIVAELEEELRQG
jgi:hypothetical protein